MNYREMTEARRSGYRAISVVRIIYIMELESVLKAEDNRKNGQLLA